MRDDCEFLVIGGGIAGAATAWALAERGRSGVILEKEPLPGTGASGRNAAMIRRNVPDPVLAALAVESARLFQEPPEGFRDLDFRQTGSVVLAEAGALPMPDPAACAQLGLEVEVVEPDRLASLAPALVAPQGRAAAWCPSDGVLDIAALLDSYLAAARAGGWEIRLGCPVTGLLRDGDRISGVETPDGPVRARWTINAAGGWMNQIAPDLALEAVPCRRHLMVTTPVEGIDPDHPFCWDEPGGFYFRAESGGWLVSPCDVDPWDPATPCGVSEDLMAEAAEKAGRFVAGAADLGIAHAWSGMRTLTTDDRPLIGPDARVRGLFWVAGLGGHGMTLSAAVGPLAADLLLDGHTDRLDPGLVAPGRAQGNRASAVMSS